jgi:hypothetical protein
MKGCHDYLLPYAAFQLQEINTIDTNKYFYENPIFEKMWMSSKDPVKMK